MSDPFYPEQLDYIVELNNLAAAAGYGKKLSRVLAATTDATVELGDWDSLFCTSAFYVTVVNDTSGFSVSKMYLIPVQYPAGLVADSTWYVVPTLATTGPWGAEDFQLLIKLVGATGKVHLKLRRTGGSTLSTLSIYVSEASGGTTFTASTTASTDATAYTDYAHGATIPPSVIGLQTAWIPAGAMTPRLTNGPAPGLIEMTTNKNMVRTLDFDASTQEFAQFEIAMPNSWDKGTIKFVPVWSHAATTVNFGVAWGLAAVAISNDDALDVAFGTAQASVDTGGTTNDKYDGPLSASITVAGTPADSDLVLFRVHRDPSNGSDNMAIDARLHGVSIFYTIDAANDA